MTHRSFVIPVILFGLLLIVLLVIGAVQIRPGELQLPVRYSSYGVTNIYRDKWYYLLGFIAFGLIFAAAHILTAAKMLSLKGERFAVSYLWLGVVVMIIINVMIFALLRVASFSQ